MWSYEEYEAALETMEHACHYLRAQQTPDMDQMTAAKLFGAQLILIEMRKAVYAEAIALYGGEELDLPKETVH